MSRHVAGRRPRSAWLTAWQLTHRARTVAEWLRAEAVGVWAEIVGLWAETDLRGRRLLFACAYYVIAVLAVDTLAMLISGGR
jgi:hypothetical protein